MDPPPSGGSPRTSYAVVASERRGPASGRGGRAVTQVGKSKILDPPPSRIPARGLHVVGGKGGFESPAALERRVHGRARLRVAVERVLDDGVVGTIGN